MVNKWFGVRGFGELGEDMLFKVRGLEFIIVWIFFNSVWKFLLFSW